MTKSSYSSLPQATADAFNNFSIFPQWPFAPLIITLAEYRLGLQMSQIDSARDLAAMTPRPILIIHSAGDTLLRPHHARKMYEAAQEPKTLGLVEGVRHNNPIEGHEVAYRERLLSFLSRPWLHCDETCTLRYVLHFTLRQAQDELRVTQEADLITGVWFISHQHH